MGQINFIKSGTYPSALAVSTHNNVFNLQKIDCIIDDGIYIGVIFSDYICNVSVNKYLSLS